MTRGEAIHLLTRQDIAEMGVDERAAMLLDWWSIDASDPGYATLPEALKIVIAHADVPDDAGNPLHDPLLQLALRRSYEDVLNSYLEQRVKAKQRAG